MKAQQLGQRSMNLAPMAATFPFFLITCIFSYSKENNDHMCVFPYGRTITT